MDAVGVAMTQGKNGAARRAAKRSISSQMELWYEQGFLTYAMLIVGAFCLLFAVYDYYNGDLFYASFLFACSAAVFIGLTVLVLTGVSEFLQWYFGLLLIALFFFLVLNGGVSGTGLYWCLGFSPGIVSILGYPRARYVAPLIILVLAVIFWFDLYPWPARMFEPAVELRFLAALSGLFLFTVGQDYAFRVSRAHSAVRQRVSGAIAVQRDAHTGLIERDAMEKHLHSLAAGLDADGEDCAVVMVVIENLSEHNEKLGREFGDETLRHVVDVLQRVLRSGQGIGRWAGDRFIIVLEGQNKHAAYHVQQRLQKLLSSLYLEHGGKQVAVSFDVRVTSLASCGGVANLIATLNDGEPHTVTDRPRAPSGLSLH